jgi:hypothetical protein
MDARRRGLDLVELVSGVVWRCFLWFIAMWVVAVFMLSVGTVGFAHFGRVGLGCLARLSGRAGGSRGVLVVPALVSVWVSVVVFGLAFWP